MIDKEQKNSELPKKALFLELLLRSLVHDLRGALGTTQGWLEIAELDGFPQSSEFRASLQALFSLVKTAEEGCYQAPTGDDSALGRLSTYKDVLTDSGAQDIQICKERLAIAIQLAEPRSVEFRTSEKEGWGILTLYGLDELGVAQANCPKPEVLLDLWKDDSSRRALGATLLRAVARSRGGYLRAIGPDTLELHIKRGTD